MKEWAAHTHTRKHNWLIWNSFHGILSDPALESIWDMTKTAKTIFYFMICLPHCGRSSSRQPHVCGWATELVDRSQCIFILGLDFIVFAKSAGWLADTGVARRVQTENNKSNLKCILRFVVERFNWDQRSRILDFNQIACDEHAVIRCEV